VLVNDDDLTFARVLLDEGSLEAVERSLSGLGDSLNRVVLWRACWDMVRSGELAARRYLDMVLRHAGAETEIEVLESLLAQAAHAVSVYGDPGNREPAGRALADASLEAARSAEAGSDHQLAWARSFISAARSSEHLRMVRGLLEASEVLEGLAVDTDLRWHIVGALATAGEASPEDIEAELQRDPTDRGARLAASAGASRPAAEAKSEAWTTILEDRHPTLAMLMSIMQGFQRPEQEALLLPYRDGYFEALGRVWEERELPTALAVGERLYPHHVVEDRTVEMTDEYLAHDRVPQPIRRLLLEGRDGVLRTLRARRTDADA